VEKKGEGKGNMQGSDNAQSRRAINPSKQWQNLYNATQEHANNTKGAPREGPKKTRRSLLHSTENSKISQLREVGEPLKYLT